ncbi:MAG: hypothetical protein KY475_04810 [Planctomycetes bacterium]|nr:hypothetical protein [Planctomycetota bacterium]
MIRRENPSIREKNHRAVRWWVEPSAQQLFGVAAIVGGFIRDHWLSALLVHRPGECVTAKRPGDCGVIGRSCGIALGIGGKPPRISQPRRSPARCSTSAQSLCL